MEDQDKIYRIYSHTEEYGTGTITTAQGWRLVGVSAAEAGEWLRRLGKSLEKFHFPSLAAIAPTRLALLRQKYGSMRFFVREWWFWQYVLVRWWFQRAAPSAP